MEYELTKNEEKVLSGMPKDAITLNDLKDILKMDRQTVYQTLQLLVRSGQVDKLYRGVYKIRGD
jgi:predicted transcriptional regulator